MPVLRIRTDAAASDTLVPDLGITVPGGGGFVDFTEYEALSNAQLSHELREFLVDNAFPPDATLNLYDMDLAQEVPQGDALTFLSTLNLPSVPGEAYSALLRDEAGDPPPDAAGLPTPDFDGQLLIAEGGTWIKAQPITIDSTGGWMRTRTRKLVVRG